MRRFAAIAFVIALTLLASYASAQNYDVALRHDIDPKGEVFSHFDINLAEPAVGQNWFAEAIWLGNHFVLSGDCAYSKGSPIANAEWGDGGLYLFTTNGTYLSKYDKCLSFPHNANQKICGHEDFCEVGTKVYPISSTEFIADLSSSAGHPRPPIAMQIANNKMVRTATVPGFVVPAGSYGYAYASCTPGTPCYALGFVRHFDGKLIGVKGNEGTSIDDPFYEPEFYSPVYSNVLYDAKSLSLIGSWPMSIKPLAAGGDFVISRRVSYYGPNVPSTYQRFIESIDLYKIVNNQPQFVRHLMDGFPAGQGLDTIYYGRESFTDPLRTDRLIFQTIDYEEFTKPNGNLAIRQTGITTYVYEPGANDITLIKTIKTSAPVLAIAGDYVVTSSCIGSLSADTTISGCPLNITRNGQPLTIEPLPAIVGDEELYITCERLGWTNPFCLDINGNSIKPVLEQKKQTGWSDSVKGPGSPIGVSISPSGDMIVITRNQHVYLYKIKNFQGAGGNGTGNTTVPPGNATTQTLSLKPGWNLISSSLIGNALFASHQTTCTYTSPLWAFDSGTQQYVQATSLAGKKGMWIRAAADCTTTVTGDSLYTLNNFFPLALGAGWNFIAGPPTTVQVSELTGCTITRGPFWYNPVTNAWEQTTTLEPGKGYALRIASSCSMSYGSIPPLP